MPEWRYTGDGAFLPGVPARDLEADELRELGIDPKLLEASPIYERVSRTRAHEEAEHE